LGVPTTKLKHKVGITFNNGTMFPQVKNRKRNWIDGMEINNHKFMARGAEFINTNASVCVCRGFLSSQPGTVARI
jgi:hypothetical protein